MWQFTGPRSVYVHVCDQVEPKTYMLSLQNITSLGGRGVYGRDIAKEECMWEHMPKARQLAFLTDGRFKRKGCNWILYSVKHLVLRFLGWKPFFFPWKSMLYKHRGIISAVQQASCHFFKIYKGSKALEIFFFSVNVIALFNSGSSGTQTFYFFESSASFS